MANGKASSAAEQLRRLLLVLFVLSFKMFQGKDRENRENIARLQVEVEEKRKLDEIKAALTRLDDKYFQYNEKYKRHELLVDVLFEQSSAVIPDRSRAPLRPRQRWRPPCSRRWSASPSGTGRRGGRRA